MACRVVVGDLRLIGEPAIVNVVKILSRNAKSPRKIIGLLAQDNVHIMNLHEHIQRQLIYAEITAHSQGDAIPRPTARIHFILNKLADVWVRIYQNTAHQFSPKFPHPNLPHATTRSNETVMTS